MDEQSQTGFTAKLVAIGIATLAVILALGAWWMGRSAQQATEEAVRAVSMLYLDELAGRRGQVVQTNLSNSIKNMQVAVSLLTEDDLSDEEHLQTFQSQMKQLYGLEKFAFVDESGIIHTALGTQDNINEYGIDFAGLTEPIITVKDLGGDEKKVIIAEPLENIELNGQKLIACFMEIDMQELIDGLSLQSDSEGTTFCNLYTSDGVSLTNMVLGGLASEDNLLDALQNASFEDGYSFEKVKKDFQKGNSGITSFTYSGISETLDYAPVPNTNWMLTYLIRESVITDQISGISDNLMRRSMLQTLVTALVLFAAAGVVIWQTRQNALLAVEKEAAETENRVKQQEMQQRLQLQEQLIEEGRLRDQQNSMITALASDYRSVYYVNLDKDEGICYQSNDHLKGAPNVGDHFSFHDLFSTYAQEFVAEQYREGFLSFIDADSIRGGLGEQAVLSYRYLVEHDGKESYEMIRAAGVRHKSDRDDGIVHAVGVGFTDVDSETRQQMAQSQALSDALAVAEEASHAKTAFLSNMSHEIRTPMNAIIGLDSIALSDTDVPTKTRDYLLKIGDSAHHLLGIINDILDVSRIESGRVTLNKEVFSFPRLLEQVNTIISSQCSEKGLDYECQVIGSVANNYIGDSTKLRQVLVNVLGNAVKFTPTGGSVDFIVERTAQYADNSVLRFTVRDTGIGMDAEYLPHIFKPFSQEDSSAANKYGSTGLGLAITKSVVEMMNGSIGVESEKGKGSTFVITVTLADAENTFDYADIEIKPHEMKVLVIDDDPVACEHAKLVLEEIGIATDIADSGARAVEMVRLCRARREPYDLILVDWKMPEMDGVETTRAIRSIAGDDSAVIILTSYNWDEIIEEAVQAGVDSFIAKPLFAATVIDEFKEAFKKRSAATKSAHRADLTGRRVLLAEDVPINALIMVDFLGRKQVTVDQAENGKVAVDKFAASEPGYYDAILMDVRMPEMDGLTATMTIRALDRPDAKEIPIIALTANAFDEDVQKSLQAGMNAHLSKPVEPENLFETLESLIRD